MKKIKVVSVTIIAIMLFSFPFTAFSQTNSSHTGQNEIDIATSPHKVFFNLENLKPGDWTTRNLNIQNNGEQNFTYTFTNQFKSGSKKFYNQLLLIVKNGEHVLFDGKLKDFDELEPRFLDSGKDEDLYFEVKVPFELGNEYQGLSATFLFKLIAEGKGTNETPDNPEDSEEDKPSTPGNPTNGGDSGTPQTGTATPVFSGGLPQTGESMPTMYYLIGGLLIVFGFALYTSAQLKRRRE